MPPVVQGFLDKLHPAWWVLAAYLLINAVVAFWKARKVEGEKGRWFGTKFVYNTPKLAFMTEWLPSMNGKEVVFKFSDAEPLSLVQYKLEFEGGEKRIWGVLLGLGRLSPVGDWVSFNPIEPYGKAVIGSDKMLSLSCYSMPSTVPCVVRAYIVSWDVSHDELFEFTSLDTRCVIRANESGSNVPRQTPIP